MRTLIVIAVLSAMVLLLGAGCSTNNYYGPVRKTDPWAFDANVERGQSNVRAVYKAGDPEPVEATYRSLCQRVVVE